MEIRPVPLDQVAAGIDGRQYLITGEAGRIASALKEISDTLVVHYNEGGEFFTVAQRVPRADDHEDVRDMPVMRVPRDEWDDRVTKEMAMRFHELRNGISPCDRLDALDDQRKADTMARFDAEVGEAAYPVFRAFQRAQGTAPRIFVPERAGQLAAA
jgi:hypothetical protein